MYETQIMLLVLLALAVVFVVGCLVARHVQADKDREPTIHCPRCDVFIKRDLWWAHCEAHQLCNVHSQQKPQPTVTHEVLTRIKHLGDGSLVCSICGFSSTKIVPVIEHIQAEHGIE